MQTVAAETVPAQTAAAAPQTPWWKKDIRKTGAALNVVYGLAALGVGLSFVTTGGVLPVVLGGIALFGGAQALNDSGRELLPLKAQSFISKIFTGKEMTELKPLKPPSLAGRLLRVATSTILAISGVVSYFVGAFAVTFGGGVEGATLFFGGAALVFGGAANALTQSALSLRDAAREDARPRVQDSAPAVSEAKPAVPELAPALVKSVEAGFNQSAAVVVEKTPQAKPVITPPAAPTV